MVKRIAIVLAGILVVLLGRGLFYYSGFYSAPPSEMPSYEHIVVPVAPTTGFSDEYEEGEGIILIDLAHNNAFDIEELNVLISRLVSRSLTIEFLTEEADLKRELLGVEEELEEEIAAVEEEIAALEDELSALKEEEAPEEEIATVEEEIAALEDELSALEEEKPEEEELPVADAFIIICPRVEFSEEERDTIDKFVDNEGKLLLIADPTRRSKMSSLSLRFGLIFELDYLYNMKEYDTNYRNIFVTEFREDEITKNLEKIAFYTAGSVTSAHGGLAFVDENTFSSVIETRKGLSPIALAPESNALAVYDLTFMTEPYNGVGDNNQLISNIADWLAGP